MKVEEPAVVAQVQPEVQAPVSLPEAVEEKPIEVTDTPKEIGPVPAETNAAVEQPPVSTENASAPEVVEAPAEATRKDIYEE